MNNYQATSQEFTLAVSIGSVFISGVTNLSTNKVKILEIRGIFEEDEFDHLMKEYKDMASYYISKISLRASISVKPK